MIHKYLKVFFFRTIGPISHKLDTKHPWIMRIQVCSNEGPHIFPRGDNSNIMKLHWKLLKIFRTTGPISIQLGTKHPCVMRMQICSNERPFSFPRGDTSNNKNKLPTFKNHPPRNHWANFNQTWHKASLGEGYSNWLKRNNIGDGGGGSLATCIQSSILYYHSINVFLNQFKYLTKNTEF